MLPRVVGEFRAVTDPTLRFTPSGMAVAEFRMAANSRKQDASGQWVDDKVCWLTAVVFKKAAENVAESVTKGSLVNVEGRLQTEDWTTQEGEKRQTYKVVVDTIGLSINIAPAKAMTSTGGGGAVTRSSGGDDDPFATPATPAASGGGDEPPF